MKQSAAIQCLKKEATMHIEVDFGNFDGLKESVKFMLIYILINAILIDI